MSDKQPVGDEHLGKFCYCESHVNPHSTGWCTVDAQNKKPLVAQTHEDAGIECMVKGYNLFQRERTRVLPRDLKPSIMGHPTFVERRDPKDGSSVTFSKVTAVEKVKTSLGTRYKVTHEGAFGHTTFTLSPKSSVVVYQYTDYNVPARAGAVR